MKNWYRIILLLLIVYSIAVAQAPDTAWTKIYGEVPLEERSYSILQTPNREYITVGYKTTPATGSEDFWIIKTDSVGDLMWEKLYGGNLTDIAYDIKQTYDGGYVVVGQTKSFGIGYRNVWLLKIDGDGDTIWTQIYGWSNSDNFGYSIQEIANEGYIICGSSQGRMLLIRTDMNGNSLWIKEYPDGYYGEGHCVELTTDGGFILAGVHCPETYDFYLVKTDANGDTIWTKSWGGTAYDRLFCVKQASDGGYITAGGLNMWYDGKNGRDSPDICLTKLNGTGSIEWMRTYGSPIANDFGQAVIETPHGDFVTTGGAYHDSLEQWCFPLIKTSAQGDSIWMTHFFPPNGGWAHDIELTDDGGYILAGWASGGYIGDIFLLKTKPDTFGVFEYQSSSIEDYKYHSTIVSGPFLSVAGLFCKVFDLTGRQIHTLDPAPGIYFIQLDDKITQKVIKIK